PGKIRETEIRHNRDTGSASSPIKEGSRSEDAVKDAKRGTSEAPRSGPCSLTAVRAEATKVRTYSKGAPFYNVWCSPPTCGTATTDHISHLFSEVIAKDRIAVAQQVAVPSTPRSGGLSH